MFCLEEEEKNKKKEEELTFETEFVWFCWFYF